MPDDRVIPALDRVLEELGQIKNEYRRHRWIMRVTLAVLATSVFLLSGAGYLYVRNSDVAACEAGNQVRTGLLAFVDTILMPAVVPENPTPQQAAAAQRRAVFIDEAHRDFKLRDC